jgi:hypothetical protein
MTDPIETICNLTGCSHEEAERVYNETKDMIEAVDRLLETKPSSAEKYIQSKKKPKQVTEEEKIIGPYRAYLKELDEKRSTSLGQHGHEGSVEMLDRHAEMVLQNNCSQECQLPSLQSAVETRETACPSQSEYSCDSQLNVQTSPCSGLQSLQSFQGQGTVLSQMGERTPV